jgi:cyclic pyranopterin phosphate synthase
MPEEGMQWIPRSEILTFEEIERLARICVERFGFDGIRLTGGEPTMRAHIVTLVEKLAHLGIDLSMTTNGATLRHIAHDLRQAGLNRLNISLDTLDRAKFERMTRRDELDNVLAGIAAAQDAGFDPVKINALVERDVNDDEIVAAIAAEWPLEQVPARGAAPADRWRYLDGAGVVGVIPTVTKPFCGDCDRVRLTADGQFRTCLFANDEFDLRELLRNGASDADIEACIEAAVGTKWAGHQINQVNFIRPARSMSQIGG